MRTAQCTALFTISGIKCGICFFLLSFIDVGMSLLSVSDNKITASPYSIKTVNLFNIKHYDKLKTTVNANFPKWKILKKDCKLLNFYFLKIFFYLLANAS